jgi:hypothetical protein
VAVERTWRSADRRYLVDQVLDEPGVEFRVWDAEGAPLAEAAGPDQLRAVLVELGVDQDRLEPAPPEDPWCE